MKLSDIGVAVHIKREYPYVHVSYETREKIAKVGTVFHTCQREVADELVQEKWNEILRAMAANTAPPAVEVFGYDGKVWVMDGHHTLAAYLLHGQLPLLSIHGPGQYRVVPPVFRKKEWRPRR